MTGGRKSRGQEEGACESCLDGLSLEWAQRSAREGKRGGERSSERQGPLLRALLCLAVEFGLCLGTMGSH